jgi:AraC family transcriptional regulator
MKPDTRSFYLLAVQRVITHLFTHLDESADLHALAQLAGLSPFHFHRVFRGMVGETPLELLRRVRMERAAAQLTQSNAPVTRIAFDAGYDTHEAFTRAFRSSYGTSPSAYRRDQHKWTTLAAASGLHFSSTSTPSHFIPRDTGGQTMQIEIDTLPPLRLAAVAHFGAYNQIGSAFEKLGALAGAAGLFQHPGTMMVAAYHDDPEATPVAELRSDAGISVPDAVVLPSGLEELRVPGGRYIKHTYIGPYSALNDVWSRFMGEAIPASGQTLIDGPALEIYRSDMRTTPPEQLRTDLLVPIA